MLKDLLIHMYTDGASPLASHVKILSNFKYQGPFFGPLYYLLNSNESIITQLPIQWLVGRLIIPLCK